MSEPTTQHTARAWGCPTCDDHQTVLVSHPDFERHPGESVSVPCPTCAAHWAGCAKAWEEGGMMTSDSGCYDSSRNPYHARRDHEQGGAT